MNSSMNMAMKIALPPSLTNIAFRGQSDQKNHGITSPYLNSEDLPPVTLSRVNQEGGSKPTTHSVLQSPFLAVQQAILNQKEAEEDKLEQARQAFLNNPIAEVNGQPFTGLDLIKLIDEATQKKWVKRDWSMFTLSSLLSVVTLGIMPLVEKDIRKLLRDGLKRGLPSSQFAELLTVFKRNDGAPLRFEETRSNLANLRLIVDDFAERRIILTPLAREILSKHSGKTFW